MTLLLSGDEYCYKFEDRFYLSETGFVLVNRYLVIFENIRIIFRTKLVNSKEQLGKYQYVVDKKKVKFLEVPFFQGPKQFFSKFQLIKTRIKDEIKECDFAILRLPSITAFVVYREIRKINMPFATEIVFDCQDAAQASKSFFMKKIWSYLHHLQVKACSEAKGVACVTQNYLQKRYFPKSSDSLTSYYSSIELGPEFYYRPRLFPDKRVIRLIHVANQVQYNGRKGHNEMIDVLCQLKKLGNSVELYFVGEDYMNGVAQLKKYAEEREVLSLIKFTGFLTKKELREQLIDADIAILPTKAEGLPRVIIEAMALGLPVITSPVSGNPELISQSFLVGYNDIIGMVDACRLLGSNKEIYERESNINFNKSLEYSSEILNPRRTEFYEKLKKVVQNDLTSSKR